MESTMEMLRAETRPLPGRPGWRVDKDGHEWYSDAWIDDIQAEEDDVMPCGCSSGSCYCDGDVIDCGEMPPGYYP